MATSPPTNPFGVHIKDLVPVSLDQTNYMKWNHLVLPVLEIYDLQDHIDGSSKSPSPTSHDSNNKEIPTPKFLKWRRIDRLILTWLNATIHLDLLPLLFKCTSAHEAWTTLKSHFLDITAARELHYKYQLQSIKKGDLSITTYMTKLKDVSDSLLAIDHSVSDHELVLHALQGLPASYESFITVAANQKPSPTFKELWTMLLTHESRLEQIHGIPILSYGPCY
ncbi:hypothetical protein Salat_2771500 [Sesamum alatum]|uniref:Retrotransposon Copia-like N-terminal domain-containing protein n=1 Tax=Sesamum alatum TaxID=300844 RepID=A0AAE1XKN7_9LAMI|nr:hypothetical protein Salat_2771500 [Sesamum alatum]